MTAYTPPLDVIRAIRRTLGPSFASDAQREFFDSEAPELLYSGAVGAGKSRILCEKGWYLAKRYPGVTIGIFRKVAASLAATTLRTFELYVLEREWIKDRNKTENWFDLTNGSRIYFLGLDRDPVTGVPTKVGSLELGWAGVDEAIECDEGDWLMLNGRLRDQHIPWHQIAAATNPAHPKHWLKIRFTPPTADRQYIHTTAQDNRFLPEDYRLRVADMPDNAIGRRLGRGEWAVAEGVIWSLPDPQVRVVEGPFKRVVAGLDWGFVHHFATEVVGQSGSGRLAVVGEIWVAGYGLDQLAEPLAAVYEAHGVDAVYCDPSEPGLMAELGRHLSRHRVEHQNRHANGDGGPCTLRASLLQATNDVMPGLGAVDRQFREGMTVDPTCVGLLTEVPAYTWAPNRSGQLQEKPVEVNDDACDALRYAVMAFEPDPNNPWAALSSAGGVA